MFPPATNVYAQCPPSIHTTRTCTCNVYTLTTAVQYSRYDGHGLHNVGGVIGVQMGVACRQKLLPLLLDNGFQLVNLIGSLL